MSELTTAGETVNLYAVWTITFPDKKGLVVWWKFDGNGNDSSENGFNLSGSTVTYKNDRHGQLTSSAYFNGSASLSLNKATGVQNTMSISMWVKPEKSGYYSEQEQGTISVGVVNQGLEFLDFPMILLPAKGSSIGELGIAVGTDRIEVFAQNANWIDCFYSKNKLSLGSGWHHVVMTVSNIGTPIVYLDGDALNGRAAKFNSGSYNYIKKVFIATALSFGGRKSVAFSGYAYTGNLTYKGYIDDFMIYNRALSAAEVKQLYDASK